MITTDSGIALDFPTDWQRFTESGRLIFQSGRREEVIVSARRLEGKVEGSAHEAVLQRMVDDGLETARRSSASPELRVTKAMSEDSPSHSLRCWSTTAETVEGDGFFGQAVLSHAQGTLFFTYEAPFVVGADAMFRALLGRIRTP